MFLIGQVNAIIDILKSERVDIVVPLIENIKEQTMTYKGITIFKQKKCSTWYARPRINGKQLFISAKTQKDCYEKLKNAFKENITFKNLNNKTLKTWIEEWYKIYKTELRERTQQDIKYIINKLPKELCDKDIKEINTITIKNYLDTITSERTKQKTYTILNDIFDKAEKHNITDKNPLSVIKKPKYQSNEKYVLTIKEEETLYKKLQHTKNYIFAIALLQGLRPGELLALEYNDIDLEKRTITINKSIDGKTKDTMTKNKYSNRIIPLFNKTYEIIKDIKRNSNDRIYQNNIKNINKELQEICKNIVKEKITLYNLRHTFITRLEDNNIPEHLIQAWCGHSKGSKVTKETYTHVTKETENKYINILNNP